MDPGLARDLAYGIVVAFDLGISIKKQFTDKTDDLIEAEDYLLLDTDEKLKDNDHHLFPRQFKDYFYKLGHQY